MIKKVRAKPATAPCFLETSEVPERSLRIYARLWQFETWLRQMVYVEMRALRGDAWAQGLPATLNSFRADKALTHMPTPEMNALSYAQLSKVTELIKTDWDCFKLYFPPQALWESKLDEVSQIRHRIAHFRVGHADDHPRLLQFLRDIDQGFWRFCTSYNNAHPVLPQSEDPVTDHFLHLDPLPWGEIEPKKWARVGVVDKSQPIAMTVQVSRRPWATASNTLDGVPGHFYDFLLHTQQNRRFDYPRLLDRTEAVHPHIAHICLTSYEDTLRLTLPTMLGTTKIIELVDGFLESSMYAISPSRGDQKAAATALANDWPEYVIGPDSPLTFLDPDMPCSFFGV